MRLYEYEAKRLFKADGIPIPMQYGVIKGAEDLVKLKIDFPVMLKAQVLVGGRGKQGGIVKAIDIEEVRTAADKLFAIKIDKYPIKSLLIEEIVSGISSCYIGVTMNPTNFNNIIMVSAEGGVDIEEVAKNNPDAIWKEEVTDNSIELSYSTARKLAKFLNKTLKCNEKLLKSITGIILELYNLYQKYECKVAEINPLIITKKGPLACDAKIVLDDNALYRRTELLNMLGIDEDKRHDVAEATKNEKRAASAGFPYIDLLSEDARKEKDKLYVGLVPGGAGYGIFSIDEVANIGDRFFNGRVVPINFMDSGGGPSQSGVAEMFHLLMDNEMVDIVITSRFGGISSCDVFIRGLVQCLRDRYEKRKRRIPVYGRMVGTDLSSAKSYFEKAKKETPEPLKNLDIIVGNQMIMADIIRKGIEKGFKLKQSRAI